MADNSLSYLKRSGVKIKLADGKTHELRYDLNAIEYMQETFKDVDGFAGVKDLDKINLDSAKNIKIFLKAGLLHEYDEEPTLKEIGKLVSLDIIMDFEKHIAEALLLSMPERDTEATEDSEKK
jgi:hypothetical protein